MIPTSSLPNGSVVSVDQSGVNKFLLITPIAATVLLVLHIAAVLPNICPTGQKHTKFTHETYTDMQKTKSSQSTSISMMKGFFAVCPVNVRPNQGKVAWLIIRPKLGSYRCLCEQHRKACLACGKSSTRLHDPQQLLSTLISFLADA